MKRIGVFIATAAGAGYAPVASGTFGSAVGVLIYFLTRGWPLVWAAALIAIISVVGIWASHVAAEHFGRDDPGQVVIDEVAGQLITLFWLDLHLLGILVGFLVFRALDIVKPWPARQFEDLHGGLGIMADDVMAGVYGWLIMFALVRFVPLPW